jgi:ribosome-binding protein aMBF1 (putative translation factor)
MNLPKYLCIICKKEVLPEYIVISKSGTTIGVCSKCERSMTADDVLDALSSNLKSIPLKYFKDFIERYKELNNL